ncbi:MAG: hypothetical protein IJ329_01860 [Clostridia bacterium]|nr:hypothetical protein [Clostridia bacterium]
MTKIKNKKLLFALCALTATCSIGAVTTLTNVSADETAGGTETDATVSNVTAVYSDETNKSSANLTSLNIDGFSSVEDFTDWFGWGYNYSSLTMSDFVSYDETNQSVKINATQKLDMRFHLDTITTGKTELGNFEIKMTVRGLNVGDSENMYMASRVQWDSSDADGMALRADLTGSSSGKHTLGSGKGSYVSGGSYSNLDSSNGITITAGYVNNHVYFYYGNHLVNGYSVVSNTLSANSDAARDGNQTFGLYFTAGTEMEILDFSYERLDEAFAFDTEDETTQAYITNRLTPASNAVATYADETSKTSANLNSLKIDEFASLADFSNWFRFGYQDGTNASLAMDDYVTYDETNKSIKINNTTKRGLDFRFHPDGTIGSNSYYGKTQLGNFEIKMTVRGLNVSGSENMYMASRVTWDSTAAEYMNLQARLTGGDDGKQNFGSNQNYVSGAAYENLDTTDGITLTVGYVNNYMYFYYGDFMTNGFNVVKASISANTSNASRDGNQTFALYFTGASNYATETEILDFSYTRLTDIDFAVDAEDATTESYITTRFATQAAAVVSDAIAKLSTDTVTATNYEAVKAEVEAVETAYNALTDEGKALVENYATLTGRRAELTAYEAEVTKQANAQSVKDLISAIPADTLTADNYAAVKSAVETAETAYAALTDEEKALVDNYAVLTEKRAELDSHCVDSDTNHACDICGVAMGTHEAADGTHTCEYCGETVSECVDENSDHACDVCGTAMGTHEAAEGKHTCDYCGETVSECVDENSDHACDICGAAMGTHEAADGAHTCEYCGQSASECVDENEDGVCDVCGEETGSSEPDTPSTPDTPGEPNEPTTPDEQPDASDEEVKKGGCSASVSGFAVLGVAMAACALIKKSRK